jgi:hypothetical protein
MVARSVTEAFTPEDIDKLTNMGALDILKAFNPVVGRLRLKTVSTL